MREEVLPAQVRKREIDDPAVAEFLRGHGAYVFQEPAWCRVMASRGLQTGYYTLEDDGRMVLAQPASRMQLGFFRLLYCGLPYGGPVGDASRVAEFFDGLGRTARAEGIHRVRLSHNLYDADLGDLAGCKVQDAVQQVLHFEGRTEERIWEAMKSRTRRDARLAPKRGVTVASAAGAADREDLFGMYARTMVRNETFAVWKREMVETIWQLLVQPGQGEMLIARLEGRPLAGLISLYSGKRCFYFLGASSGEHRNLCPNDAVIWEAIRRAIARGCDDFDFMISASDDTHLIEFKSKWNTVRHPFRFYECDLSPLVCGLWNVSFQIARTRLGGRIIRRLRGQ
jgi:lipid II:glycine glycyltransferase (peptidoglycan interpeptide bridge formation enzyme)